MSAVTRVLVIDASAVVDALTGAPGSDALRTRIADEELHAPHLLDFEVVSVLRGLVLGSQLSSARAQDALTDLDDLRCRRWALVDSLRRRSFDLRNNLSGYDAAYVALAEALECPLLTRDGRLKRSGVHAATVEVL